MCWPAQFMSVASAMPILASAEPYQRWKSGSSVRLTNGGSGVVLARIQFSYSSSAL